MLASSDYAGVIRFWHLESDHAATIQAHDQRIWALDFAPHSDNIVTASRDGSVRFFQPHHQIPKQTINIPVSDDPRFAFLGKSLVRADRQQVSLWDPQTSLLSRQLGQFRSQCYSVAVARDESTILTGHDDGKIRIWLIADKGSRSVVELSGHQNDVDAIGILSDGRTIISGSYDGSIRFWNIDSQSEIARFDIGPHCRDLAVAPNERLVVGTSQNNVVVFDIHTRQRLHLLRGHQNTVQCVAFAPNSQWFVTGSHDRTIRIWDTETGHQIHVITAHHDNLSAITVSPDGQIIVSGDESGMIAFSHVPTGRVLYVEQIGNDEVVDLKFQEDGQTLLVSVDGEKVVLLRAKTE